MGRGLSRNGRFNNEHEATTETARVDKQSKERDEEK